MKPGQWQAFGRMVLSVDWPRVATNLGTFARALRGDDPEEVIRESQRAQAHARTVVTTLENVAAKASEPPTP